MKTLISKIIIAILLGVLWGTTWYFDLLQNTPWFHCEGFGCIGQGIFLFIYMPILSFLLIGVLTFFLVKENKLKHILISLGIMLVSFVIVFLIVNILRDNKKQQYNSYCQTDSDCMFYFVAGKKCNECAKPLGAVNKKHVEKLNLYKGIDYHGLNCDKDIEICPEFTNYKTKCQDNFCVAFYK